MESYEVGMYQSINRSIREEIYIYQLRPITIGD